MQEFDHAIKTVMTLKPNTAFDLAFGKQRTIKVQRKLLTQPPNQTLREALTVEIILKQKLGALPPRLRGQLQKLDGKKLARLTLRLQQISNRRDLQAWLKNGASRQANN